MSQIAKLLSQVIKAIDAEDSKVRHDLLDGKFTNTLAFTRDKEHFLKHRHHAFAECKSANGDVFYVDLVVMACRMWMIQDLMRQHGDDPLISMWNSAQDGFVIAALSKSMIEAEGASLQNMADLFEISVGMMQTMLQAVKPLKLVNLD
ncbi:hypothetical protein K7J86_004825 [Escherichia coli]|nr:hypothetical protein [Escherichia coli]